jgi:ABC-type multidrug transport system permease subunit
MNKSTKILLTLIGTIFLMTLSYFTYKFSEEDYNSLNNIDKFITVKSVTYVPNGRERALCQIVCTDNKGRTYHIINSERYFVGDTHQLYEHHDRPYIYFITFVVLFAFSLLICTITFTLLMLFGIL